MEKSNNELISSLTHFIGAMFSVAGLVLLIIFSSLYGSAPKIVGFSIFGSGLVLLYSASALYQFISWSGLSWLIAGGILYTAGVVFFALEKKFPRTGWFGMHEIFHLFVMGGSLAHFWFMFKYVLYV